MAKQICKAYLKKIVKNSNDAGGVEPKILDVVFWYAELNRLLFRGKLPELNSIHIGRRRGYYAEAKGMQYEHSRKHYYLIKLHDTFVSLKMFLSVLAHEMVHIFQYETEGKMTHGASFVKWEKRVKSLGLDFAVRM